MEVIAVEGHVPAGFYGVPFGSCECCQRPERALRLAFRRLPIQSVVLPRITDELQSVLFRLCAIVKLGVVIHLGCRDCSANLNNRQFIAADTAVQNLVPSSDRVEKPFSLT